MSKHTPGPWTLYLPNRHDRPSRIKDEDGVLVATIPARMEADARLIADAPRLLDENQRLHEENERLRLENERWETAVRSCVETSNGRETEWGDRAQWAFGFLHAAIAKATGEKT